VRFPELSVNERNTIMKNVAVIQTQEMPQVRTENRVEDQNYLSPAINIFETKEGFVLEAEMPGVNKDGLEVTLEGSALTLVGRRNIGSPGSDVIYRESKPAHFRRVFELDPTIDAAKISARIEQGVLTLTLPKTEKVKPRKIAVGE
jgi:HSP20 family protein